MDSNHTVFDLNFNALLQNKIDLKDAVVTPQVVSADDMQDVFNKCIKKILR